MDFKAYGMDCVLSSESLVLTPISFLARKALGGDEPRVIMLKDVIFLDYDDGNMFVNAVITVGEVSGKTYIPVVPLRKNRMAAEVFYNALCEAVKPYGNLKGVKPAGLRNDRIQAYRDAHGVVNESMVDNIESQMTSSTPPFETETVKENTHVKDSTDVMGAGERRHIQVSEYDETMPPIVAKEYAIIDLETTGLSPDKGDRIIEIGIMIVDAAYNVISVHETLINPKRPVALTHVHGIDDRMLAHAPTIEDVNDDVLALLHNRIVVAHNASFEQRFLNSELSGRDLTSNNFLDTLKYARLITPTENHKLGTVAGFYGVPYVDSHTAMGDVIITREVLSRMIPAHEDSRFIASEELTPYFHAVLGDTQPVVYGTNWVGR